MVTSRPLKVSVATTLFSAESAAQSLDQQVETLMRPFTNGLADFVFYKIDLFGQPFPLIVLWLASAAVLNP